MFIDDYDFDYDNMANDADDIYEDEVAEHREWENYYHNLAEEIEDD